MAPKVRDMLEVGSKRNTMPVCTPCRNVHRSLNVICEIMGREATGSRFRWLVMDLPRSWILVLAPDGQCRSESCAESVPSLAERAREGARGAASARLCSRRENHSRRELVSDVQRWCRACSRWSIVPVCPIKPSAGTKRKRSPSCSRASGGEREAMALLKRAHENRICSLDREGSGLRPKLSSMRRGQQEWAP
jgi:hypothetical protein